MNRMKVAKGMACVGFMSTLGGASAVVVASVAPRSARDEGWFWGVVLIGMWAFVAVTPIASVCGYVLGVGRVRWIALVLISLWLAFVAAQIEIAVFRQLWG